MVCIAADPTFATVSHAADYHYLNLYTLEHLGRSDLDILKVKFLKKAVINNLLILINKPLVWNTYTDLHFTHKLPRLMGLCHFLVGISKLL